MQEESAQGDLNVKITFMLCQQAVCKYRNGDDRLARGLGNDLTELFISRAAIQIIAALAERGPPGTCFLPWAGREQTWKRLNDIAPK